MSSGSTHCTLLSIHPSRSHCVIPRTAEARGLSFGVDEALELMIQNNNTRRTLMACVDSALDQCVSESEVRRSLRFHFDAALDMYLTEHAKREIEEDNACQTFSGDTDDA